MKVGDKVLVQGMTIGNIFLNGSEGKILTKHCQWDNYYGIEFKYVVSSGHSCNEIGKDGYCKWVNKKYLKEVKDMFKEGDLLELVDTTCMGAKVGANAVVMEEFDGKYITVRWIRTKLCMNQSDGKYSPHIFKKDSFTKGNLKDSFKKGGENVGEDVDIQKIVVGDIVEVLEDKASAG